MVGWSSRRCAREGGGFHMKSECNQKLSGNEVYDTACYLLSILKHSCSKPHCQKRFNLIPCSYKIRVRKEEG